MEDLVNSLPALLAIVASFVSVIIAVSKNKAEVRKLNLEGQSSVAGATDEVAESARLLLEPLNERISLLKSEIDHLNEKNTQQDLEAQNRLLERENELLELREYVKECTKARDQTLQLLDEVEEALHAARIHIVNGNGK